MGKGPPPQSFRERFNSYQTGERRLGLCFTLFGLVAAVVVLTALFLGTTAAPPCVAVPRRMVVHIPLKPSIAPREVRKLLDAMDLGSFEVLLNDEQLRGSAPAAGGGVDLHVKGKQSSPHDVTSNGHVTYFNSTRYDSPHNALATHGLSLSTIRTERDATVKHQLCEYRSSMCKSQTHLSQLGVRHRVLNLITMATRNVAPGAAAKHDNADDDTVTVEFPTVMTECLSLSTKHSTAINDLRDLLHSFPAFTPGNFFAGSQPLIPQKHSDVAIRQFDLGMLRPTFGKDTVLLKVSLLSMWSRADPVDDKLPPSGAVLVLWGALKNPFSSEFDTQISDLREQLLWRLEQGDVLFRGGRSVGISTGSGVQSSAEVEELEQRAVDWLVRSPSTWIDTNEV